MIENNWILAKILELKFESEFAPLFNSDDLVELVYQEINFEKPKIIISKEHFSCSEETECHQIQFDYEGKTRDQLSDPECVDILLSLSLLNNQAIFHFLPRLIKYLVTADGNHEEAILFWIEGNQKDEIYNKHKNIFDRIEIFLKLKISAIERIEDNEQNY